MTHNFSSIGRVLAAKIKIIICRILDHVLIKLAKPTYASHFSLFLTIWQHYNLKTFGALYFDKLKKLFQLFDRVIFSLVLLTGIKISTKLITSINL